jgi:hypothetical protein
MQDVRQKAILVTESQSVARAYDEVFRHQESMNSGLFITSQPTALNKINRRKLLDCNDPLQLLIVTNRTLDYGSPSVSRLYLDAPMSMATLSHALDQINSVSADKEYAELIDFRNNIEVLVALMQPYETNEDLTQYGPNIGDMHELYHRYLEEIAEECQSVRGPIWRRPDILNGGLPQREKNKGPYKGINRLLLWHITRETNQPSYWSPCTEESSNNLTEHGLVISYRPRPNARPVLIPSLVSANGTNKWYGSDRTQLILESLKPLTKLVPNSVDKAANHRENLFSLLKALVMRQLENIDGKAGEEQLIRLRASITRDPTPLVAEISTAFLLAKYHLGTQQSCWSGPADNLLPTISPANLPTFVSLAQKLADMVELQLETFLQDLPRHSQTGFHYPPQGSMKMAESLSIGALDDERQIWNEIGKRLREHMTRGAKLPSQFYSILRNERSNSSKRIARLWNILQKEHLRACWPHLYWRFSYQEFAVSGIPWDQHTILNRCQKLNRSNNVNQKTNSLSALSLHEFGGMLGKQPQAPLHERELIYRLFLSEFSNDGQMARRQVNKKLRNNLIKAENPEQIKSFEHQHERLDWEQLQQHLLQEGCYRREARTKRDGTLRWLDIPSPALAHAQRLISQSLTRYFPAHGHCAGFAPFRSPAYHARLHAGAKAAVIMDISDFFGSVRKEHIEYWLCPDHQEESPFFRLLPSDKLNRRNHSQANAGAHPLLDWTQEGRDALLNICFYPEKEGQPSYLPQGAPSSPILANLAAFALDERICLSANRGFKEQHWSYSRYADDLVLSTRDDDPLFIERAARILGGHIRAMGWKPKRRKTIRWAVEQGDPLMICGIRIPKEPLAPLTLSRKQMRRVRVAMHRSRNHNDCHADRGLLSYVYSVTGDQRYRAFITKRIRELGERIAGSDYLQHFLEGWAGY